MPEYTGKEKGKEKSKDEIANIKKTNVEDCLFVVGARLVEVAPGLFLNRRKEGGGEVWVVKIKRPRIFRVLGAVLGDPQEGLPTLTQKQAIAKAKRWRSSIRGKKPPRQRDRTVTKAVETYLSALGDSATIQKRRLTGPAKRIIESLGNYRIDFLGPTFLREWAEHLLQDPLKADKKPHLHGQAVVLGWSPPQGTRFKVSAANRAISLLKAALELAYANGWVTWNTSWRYLQLHELPPSMREWKKEEEAIAAARARRTEEEVRTYFMEHAAFRHQVRRL